MAAFGPPPGQPAPPSNNCRNFVQTTGSTSTTMVPGPIWGSTSNVPSLGRSRVSAGSSQSRRSEVFITVTNALQRNDMVADAILANDKRIVDLRPQLRIPLKDFAEARCIAVAHCRLQRLCRTEPQRL